MNSKTPPTEETFAQLCREIVHAAQASEAEIQAAAETPFLYQRLRAQIAAEQKPIAASTPPRSTPWDFVAVFGTLARLWHWERWALAAVAVIIAVWANWQWQQPAAPPVAPPSQAAAIATADAAPQPAPTRQSLPSAKPGGQKARKTASAKPIRVRALADEVEEAEIVTDFLPLTYTANRDEQQGQIVRMEMPRALLATLGVPLVQVTGDRVKADVMLSEDGVALAIRFIQPQ
jgi:hypothetical protein